MVQITFYEKPGCIANRRQTALLEASGHVLDVRNLLTEGWTAERLRPFFGDRPVAEWVNLSAPAVKAGDVVPEALSEAQAIAAMCADPLLIRRPLMQVGEARRCGFDVEEVRGWIGLAEPEAPVGDSCPKMDPETGAVG